MSEVMFREANGEWRICERMGSVPFSVLSIERGGKSIWREFSRQHRKCCELLMSEMNRLKTLNTSNTLQRADKCFFDFGWHQSSQRRNRNYVLGIFSSSI